LPRLPNADRAVVRRDKVTLYLLNRGHPQGRGKALFFERFGFQLDRWEDLQNALIDHANIHDALALEPSAFGTKYAIEGRLATPDGRSPTVRAIWFVANGAESPIFVTAFPGKENET